MPIATLLSLIAENSCPRSVKLRHFRYNLTSSTTLSEVHRSDGKGVSFQQSVSVSHVDGPTYGTLANVLYILPSSVNLCFSETENRIMVGGAYNSSLCVLCVCVCVLQLTGRHVVRDVTCKNCETRLGWIYVKFSATI